MCSNLLHHLLSFIQNPPVSESQHAQTLGDHVRVSVLVVVPSLMVIVHGAIAFNNEVGIATVEVSDVITKLVLSSELETEQLTIAEKSPQQGFGGSLIPSEFTRPFFQTGKLITAPVLSGLSHFGSWTSSETPSSF